MIQVTSPASLSKSPRFLELYNVNESQFYEHLLELFVVPLEHERHDSDVA